MLNWYLAAYAKPTLAVCWPQHACVFIGDAGWGGNTPGEVLRDGGWVQRDGDGAAGPQPGGPLQLLQQEGPPVFSHKEMGSWDSSGENVIFSKHFWGIFQNEIL